MRLRQLKVVAGPDGLYRRRDLPSYRHPFKRHEAEKLIGEYDTYIGMLAASGAGRTSDPITVMPVAVPAAAPAAHLPFLADDVI